MRRRVNCVDRSNNNVTVPDRFCDANTKPPEEASCGSGPCATGWRKGPWSKVIENKIDRYLAIILLQCSRTCRTGYQRRKVECIDTGAVVPDDQCDVDLRPVSERFCNEHIKCFRKLSSTSDCYIIVLAFLFCSLSRWLSLSLPETDANTHGMYGGLCSKDLLLEL